MILFSTLMHLLIDAAFAVAMECVLKFKALIAKATLYKVRLMTTPTTRKHVTGSKHLLSCD